MGFVKLCMVDDVPDNSMRRFELNAVEVLVVRYEGHLYALSERCTHRGGPLSEGVLEKGVVTCPLHFGQFDVKSGEVLGPPPSEPLRIFESKVQEGALFISTPEAVTGSTQRP